MSSTPTFIIAGASLAGAKAAETLRGEGFDGRILLLGDEPDRPYERPPLSKEYLRSEVGRDKLYVHEAGFYYSDQYDLGMEYWGHATGRDEVVVRGDPATHAFAAFWVRAGRVVAGMHVNLWDAAGPIEALVGGGRPVDAGQLADPGIPLDALAPGYQPS
jgi:hypothetical protein